MNKTKYTVEEKLYAVKKCIRGECSIASLARSMGIENAALRQWIRNYKALGKDGLESKGKQTNYDIKLKEQAVLDYLAGCGSLTEICKKYKIRSISTLQSWIIKYNDSHEEEKTSITGGAETMTKGRKTSYTERIEIAKYCIEQDYNYKETSAKYKVSYNQVYDWVKKYIEGGEESLKDRRGKEKPESELTEVDKLKAENKRLQAENKYKEMEIEFLKKLKEIEGRRF